MRFFSPEISSNEFENFYVNSWQKIIPLWEKYCIHQNKKISFHNNKKLIKGKFEGITNEGHAQIKLNGKIETYGSGVVTL